jgi:CO/xanthine dehydrogenase Mo-binding subunit
LAEAPTTTIAPAIINAIFNATGGRITHLPATPERILAALDEIQE